MRERTKKGKSKRKAKAPQASRKSQRKSAKTKLSASASRKRRHSVSDLLTELRDPREVIADLTRRLDESLVIGAAAAKETKGAREREIAAAEILKAIASSPSDVQPVFETIARSAAKLFQPSAVTITTLKDGKLHWNTTTASQTDFDVDRVRAAYPISFDPDQAPSARAILERRVIEIPDATSPDTPEFTRKLIVPAGMRSLTFVPLIKGSEGVGTIILIRPEAGARLSESQLTLVNTFADQAVIGIENARLFKETKEALERQTATSEILRVIASSPSDVQPVFDAIADSACRVVGGFSAVVTRVVGQEIHLAAFTTGSEAGRTALTQMYPQPTSSSLAAAQVVRTGRIYTQADTESDAGVTRELARARGFRSLLSVPMLRDSKVIGTINVTRAEPGGFDENAIGLMRTFADQAVIAIQNARLFNETREALERQTATADILRVIARSPSDVAPVFEAIASSAKRLLGGHSGAVMRVIDGVLHLAAFTSLNPQADAALTSIFPMPTSATRFFDRVVRGEPYEERDTELAPLERGRRIARERGYRSSLIVPLMNAGVAIGAVSVTRVQPSAFSSDDVQLLQTFSDQAVIAIENARLFDEVQQRTRELEESLQQQTATADVLKSISRSTFDLQTVLDTLVESAAKLCSADTSQLSRKIGSSFFRVAWHGFSDSSISQMKNIPINLESGAVVARALRNCEIVHVPDVLAHPNYPGTVASAFGGVRTALSVPMVRENSPIGAFTISRTRVEPFTDSQIELIKVFADQAVIAISNVELFEQIQERTRELSQSLDDLRAAQDRLVQTEKLASLGQLTAGIAHEIKNPLNFVNNFSALSAELVDELNDTLKKAMLTAQVRNEVDELTGLLRSNFEKIVQHGKRADSIVKNMLLHSREGSSQRQSAEVNKLVEESLNLAYHGARAEKSGFTITLKHDLDPEAGALELYPQEMTRALLNLISNGFYAATKRKAEGSDEAFEPVLSAATRNLGQAIEIRIRDNGIGITPEVRDKIFNPFFTTKPTGEGTGLGLSMTHDIIVRQHGGRIEVETEPGAFTEFIITLPRDGGSAVGQKPE